MTTPTPTAESFRAVGYTPAAIDYPLSPAAIQWLRRWNGVPAGTPHPPAWEYAPSSYEQARIERYAREGFTKFLGYASPPQRDDLIDALRYALLAQGFPS